MYQHQQCCVNLPIAKLTLNIEVIRRDTWIMQLRDIYWHNCKFAEYVNCVDYLDMRDPPVKIVNNIVNYDWTMCFSISTMSIYE